MSNGLIQNLFSEFQRISDDFLELISRKKSVEKEIEITNERIRLIRDLINLEEDSSGASLRHP